MIFGTPRDLMSGTTIVLDVVVAPVISTVKFFGRLNVRIRMAIQLDTARFRRAAA
jgi:hypothetical protein